MINANKANAITAIIKAERCLIFDKLPFLVVNFIFSLRKYNYLINYTSSVLFYKKNTFTKKITPYSHFTNSIFLFVASSITK
jgi:hypothetical protein